MSSFERAIARSARRRKVKKLKFDAYEPRQDGRTDGTMVDDPLSARAWALLWTALINHSASNVEQTVLAVKAYKRVKASSELKSASEPMSRRLLPAGAEIELGEELKVVKEAVEKFRPNIPLANVEALAYLDVQLGNSTEDQFSD